MKQDSARLSSYLSWLAKNVQNLIDEARKIRRYAYEIVSWKKGEDIADDQLIVRITGTRIDVPMTPLSIYNDHALLAGFAPHDIKMIFTLVKSLEAAPKYQLLVTEFRTKLADHLLTIKVKNQKKLLRLSLNELAKNLGMIKEFSPQEAFQLGMLYGEYQLEREQELLHDLIKTKTDDR